MTTNTRNRKPRRPRTKTRRTRPTVDLRKPLPTRPKPDGHSGITPTDLAEIRAALHATSIGIRVPVLAWRATHNGARIDTPDGNHLLHTPTAPIPLTAYTLCPHGAHHAHPITNPHDLHHAVTKAALCRAHHAPDDFTWPTHVRLTPPIHTLTALTDDADDGDDTPAPPTRHPTWAHNDDENDLERTQPIDTRALTNRDEDDR